MPFLALFAAGVGGMLWCLPSLIVAAHWNGWIPGLDSAVERVFVWCPRRALRSSLAWIAAADESELRSWGGSRWSPLGELMNGQPELGQEVLEQVFRSSGDAGLRWACVMILGSYSGTAAVPALLLEALEDGDDRVREDACSLVHLHHAQRCMDAVTFTPPEDPPSLHRLVTALSLLANDPNPAVRFHAVGGLGKCLPVSERALGPMVEALLDPDPDIRWIAAVGLKDDPCSALTPMAVRPLLEVFDASGVSTQASLLSFLARISPRLPELDALVTRWESCEDRALVQEAKWVRWVMEHPSPQ